jgi:uncharacterized protein
MNIFADTSGWASLLDTDQEYHLPAASIYTAVQQSNQQLITTNYVIAELVSLLNSPMRYPRGKAVHFVNSIKNSKFVRVVHIDETLDNEAWELLSKRLDKTWSLVDCSSFVVMQREKLTDAFTADHHFAQAGFTPLLRVPK